MDKIEKLIGESAGKICYSNIEDVDYLLRKVIESAECMWENYKSGWLLLDCGADGTTIWESPDENSRATVSPDCEIEVTDVSEL